MVVNTSFNVDGEPVVRTPADAIRTFHTSGPDILFPENCVIRKTVLAEARNPRSSRS